MNTNMTGFGWFFKNLCFIVLWMKVALSLEGLRVPPEIDSWIYDTFDNNFDVENNFTKYLWESSD